MGIKRQRWEGPIILTHFEIKGKVATEFQDRCLEDFSFRRVNGLLILN